MQLILFYNGFVNEQIEEEATVNEILDKIKLTEGVPSELLFMDAKLAKRAAHLQIYYLSNLAFRLEYKLIVKLR